METEKTTKTISARITEKEFDFIEEYCLKNGITRNEYIVTAVRELNKHNYLGEKPDIMTGVAYKIKEAYDTPVILPVPVMYPISRETQLKNADFNAYANLRDKYINVKYFSHKFVERYARKSQKARLEFWEMVYAEHPELKRFESGTIHYEQGKGYVYLAEKQNNLK